MQRASIPGPVIQTLFLADGLVIVFIAMFAHVLGIDPNADWGRSRIVILAFGVFLIGISIFLFKQRPAFTTSETIKRIILIGHVWTFIIIIYTWFITFGTFTSWRASTHYYSLLADAFGKGQLHVDIDPGAVLLETEDPYNPNSGRGIDDEIWDMSFYKGKLYLYWGAVPALLLIPFQITTHQTIADIYLVFFFYCGLLIFNSLILIKLWQRYFPEMPVSYVLLSIFLVGLTLPIVWSLNIPDIYEAAGGAGQFFLMGGVYFTICAFEKNIQKRYLFLAGLFWACSVGSRAINLFALLLLTPWVLYWIYKKVDRPITSRLLLRTAAALLLPLGLGAAAIGWYNLERFDSPFEFGLRYQITIHNLNELMPLTFKPDYIPANLFAYVVQPFEFIENFPFIQPVTTQSFLERFRITPPMIYFGGRMVGFLIYAPFLILALLPFLSKHRSEANSHYQFVITLLGLAFAANLIALLFFFFAQLRYSVDIISPISLLAILGYWHLARSGSQNSTVNSKFFVFTAHLLLVITITASLLLAFSSETNRMERMNPALMDRIESVFILSEK